MGVVADTGGTYRTCFAWIESILYHPGSCHSKCETADDSKFNKIPDLFSIAGDDGITRYFSGNFMKLDLARKSLMTMKQQGFKDAFICAFSGLIRISIIEAEELLKRK
jgi:hypothetical protein